MISITCACGHDISWHNNKQCEWKWSPICACDVGWRDVLTNQGFTVVRENEPPEWMEQAQVLLMPLGEHAKPVPLFRLRESVDSRTTKLVRAAMNNAREDLEHKIKTLAEPRKRHDRGFICTAHLPLGEFPQQATFHRVGTHEGLPFMCMRPDQHEHEQFDRQIPGVDA